MPSSRIIDNTIHSTREQNLAAASGLFEIGDLPDASTDESYIKRLNLRMARCRRDMERSIPATLADAINQDGALKKHAELFVLGRWLLLEGHPGMDIRGGRQGDPKDLLRCVAAVMVQISTHSARKERGLAAAGRNSRQREVTKHDLAKRWERMFDEKVAPSQFDSRLRSAKRILPLYLQHLKSGHATYGGMAVRKSPEIQRVLDAISVGISPPRKHQADILVEPAVKQPANLAPFEVQLGYQSLAHEEEYRRLPKGTRLDCRLRYLPTKTAPTSSSGQLRSDRVGKIVLEPDVDIQGNYKTTALIDRLVIVLETGTEISSATLKTDIEKETGAILYVHDRREANGPGDGWGVPLQDVDQSKLTGAPLAVMIQEPTPDLLSGVLKAIKDGPGLVGPVMLHLVEVSVDFYPKNADTPEETILRREQMVGLLQRHHWTRPSLLLRPTIGRPRDIDARQIHDDGPTPSGNRSKTRYLFSHDTAQRNSSKIESDSTITNESVRKRVLGTKPGYDLMLNSTLVKGAKRGAHHVRVQHKIADQRNRNKNALVDLSYDLRRARVEVTISGADTLKDRGLVTVEDLAGISFRKLARGFLTFKLGMIEPYQHLLEDAKAQMLTRGVYGLNLRLRVLDLERRAAVKQAGGKLPRKTDRETKGLDDWPEMNDIVGKALDELKRCWSGFSTK